MNIIIYKMINTNFKFDPTHVICLLPSAMLSFRLSIASGHLLFAILRSQRLWPIWLLGREGLQGDRDVVERIHDAEGAAAGEDLQKGVAADRARQPRARSGRWTSERPWVCHRISCLMS